MTVTLTPGLAVDYIGSLWVDLRGVVVVDKAGITLAGDAALAPAVAELVATSAPREAVRSDAVAGVLYAACSATHSLGILVGPEALEAVVVCDLLAVLDDLGGC